MSPWTNSFLVVQDCARKYASAWDKNNTYKFSNSYIAFWWKVSGDQGLAIARTFLELALADYKVQDRIGRAA